MYTFQGIASNRLFVATLRKGSACPLMQPQNCHTAAKHPMRHPPSTSSFVRDSGNVWKSGVERNTIQVA